MLEERNTTTIRSVSFLVSPFILQLFTHVSNQVDALSLRQPMRHNHQPTNRAPNEPARLKCAQESIFWVKYDRFGAKHPNYFGRAQKIWYQHIKKNI